MNWLRVAKKRGLPESRPLIVDVWSAIRNQCRLTSQADPHQSFLYLARKTSGCIYFEGLPADAGCHSGKASTKSCRKTPAIIRRNLMATPQTLEQESNPWEQQAARFNLAAEKLKLDQGLWPVLQQPNREIIVHIPVAMDNGQLEDRKSTRLNSSHLGI